MPEDVHKDEEAPEGLTDNVVNKYIAAGRITNAVLQEVVAKVVPGVTIGELCDLGDSRTKEMTANIFKKEKDLLKGIAMPTCISVNNIVCHYSPLKSDKPVEIKEGDVVKVDLGAHIGGYMATAAHTVVVGASKENKCTGKKADALLAAYNAIEASIRTMQPSKKLFTSDVTSVINKVASQFKVTAVENMLSHQIDANEHSGEKEIIQNPSDEQAQKHEKKQFDENEVFVIDVFTSTGDGKAKGTEMRTTVYRKNDIVYQLKMKNARQFFSEATKDNGVMPFSLRSFENEVHAKIGVMECERHNLVQPYPIIAEREGDFVAQFKYTVLLTPTGILKVSGIPFDSSIYESEHKIEDAELVTLLKESLKVKKLKKDDASKEDANAAPKKEDSKEAPKKDAAKETPKKEAVKESPKKDETAKKGEKAKKAAPKKDETKK